MSTDAKPPAIEAPPSVPPPSAPSLPAVEDKAAKIAALRQHRCHPRAADVVHTLLHLRLGEFPGRAGLLLSCLSSRPGEEPSAPHLLDPAQQAIVYKPRAGRLVVTTPLATAPLVAAGAGAGAGTGAAPPAAAAATAAAAAAPGGSSR